MAHPSILVERTQSTVRSSTFGSFGGRIDEVLTGLSVRKPFEFTFCHGLRGAASPGFVTALFAIGCQTLWRG